ncbi:hypothetical protein AMATHDRAFT_65762 [Amanita thiersii Skay4041]|uniref:ABC transporter domain-containing protein n=1 Tax=Amanita thiersii Skay4041 TaxID=703135 RepID=A0A2A9NJB9_9AGAR|nr:hypothetical protein AMATHDRAFT_65762 [Amanita thiersii Skay4041]
MDPHSLGEIQEESVSPCLPTSQHDMQPKSPRLLHPCQQYPNLADQQPSHGKRPKARQRCASQVAVDYFDPAGVRQLQRTMSRMSVLTRERTHPDSVSQRDEESADSELTLTVGESFDFEKSLRLYFKKRDEADIKSRQLGVGFENLRVVGIGASAMHQATLGSLMNPLNALKAIQRARHPPLRDIISGFEGVVRPGEMLLVLGRPGSGCSTLLKVLANIRDEYQAVEGTVYYDALTPQDVDKHFRGDVQYSPEDDVHFPTMTVRQTLHFAAQTRAPRPRILGQTRRGFVHFVTDALMTIFGLMHVSRTPVGDASIRGVSGGEKKRVSISEGMATRSLIHSWDNSTRGLDASTALEYVRALRIATDVIHITTIVSIYQAGEQLYETFDKVCLIYEGRMVYFGPANQARQYFMDMGYEPANRQTTADFLVSVTDPHGRKPNKKYGPFLRGPLPHTAEDFEAYYRDSEIRKLNLEDLESYKRDFVHQPKRAVAYRESASAEHAQHTRNRSPYMISVPMQIRIVMKRRAQILRGNWSSQALQSATFIIQAIIIGTVFVNLPEATSGYFSRGGVIFFAVFVPALFSMSEIPALFAQRPIIHRHQRAAMYHPMVEAVAMTLVDIPITFFTMVLFTIILYFIVGLQQSAGQYFIFFLFVFTVAVAMKTFFRLLAAMFRAEAPAQAVAGVLILALSLYTGYQIPKPSMIGALSWIFYINPLRYGFEALMVNEFHTLNGICSTLVPSGPGYEGVSLANQVCTTVGSVPGQDRVNGNRFLELSFQYKYSYLWRDYGILVAFGAGFFLLLLLFTEFNTGVAGETSVLMFKPGSKADVLQEAEQEVNDEEKDKSSNGNSTELQTEEQVKAADAEAKAALKDQPKMTNVFTWQHLDYVISAGGEHKQLLDDVSGFVAPGKLTALMGESGAGKTTLLNVLAERVTTGVVTGHRFFNGQELPPDFQAQTGYCQQTDTHVPTQTVREALVFSARLRQPESVPTAEKDAYAEKCLKMCGLERFADAMVGSLGVELRKRTTIGVELAAKPQLLLFLDEPTSGLDSQSAWAIVSFLRDLANNGQAILCTIHQPSAELFQVFDKLLLLQKGGKTVFFGDIGHNATNLINYFEESGSRKCRPGENPAEFMLDVIGAGATATTDKDWHQVWVESHLCRRATEDLEHVHTESRKQPPVKATFNGTFATPWTRQTRNLIMRQYQYYWRDPTYLMSKLMLNIVGGLFIGFTFFKSKYSIQDTQNKIFAIFMGTVLSAPLTNQISVPYIKMRSIYEIREKPSRIYHWSALLTAQIVTEIPWSIIGSVLFFFCWYWTVGLASSRAGYTFLLFGVLFPMYFSSFALAVASMSPDAEIANVLASFFFTFVIIFNGVLQPFRLLGWWKWMYHLSPYTYLIEGLVGQAIGRQSIICANQELVTVDPPSGSCGAYLNQYVSTSGGYVANPDATSGCLFCSSRTTDQFIGPSFNIFWSNHWRDLGIFCAYIIFNLILIYLLSYLVRIRSGSMVAYAKGRFVAWQRKKKSASEASSEDAA